MPQMSKVELYAAIRRDHRASAGLVAYDSVHRVFLRGLPLVE